MPGAGRFKLLDELAEEFAARCRRGERPELTEYTDRYPDLADEIRDLFPAMAEIQHVEGQWHEGTDPGPARTAPEAPRLTQVGDFQIIREIGRGGMGIVYEAEQVSLGRRVALKVLPRHVAGTSAAERFRREARAAAKLHHTNIVPVFEVGQADDVSFYAMQFIDGCSLDEVIDDLRRMHEARAPEKKGSGTFYRNGPKGASHKRYLTPFSPGGSPTISRQTAVAVLSGQFAEKGVDDAPARDGGNRPPTAALPGVPADAEPASPLSGRGSGGASGSQSVGRGSHDPARESTAGLPSSHEDSPTPSCDTPPNERTPAIPAPHRSAQLSSAASGERPFHLSVARIGRQVASALAHANARGIIHRDIKPSNLLLDAEGIVWVTDFGLAKMEEGTLTMTGDIVGTLRYMAPERFRGEADARSDVYSLGLTLYELLAFRPAFESHDRLQLIEQIKNDDPARPRSLDTRIPRDLETIVLKAIDKDPKRRYATAAEIGEDLRRFIEGEPIRARRVSEIERLWMLARRHRSAAAFLILLMVALAAGTAVSTAFAIRAIRERDRAVRAEAEARAATKHATTEAAVATAISDFLQKDLLGQADAQNQQRLGRKPDPDIKVRTLLDDASADIEGKFRDQPAVEVAIRRTIGDTYRSLYDLPAAQSQLERALDRARKDLGDRHPVTLNTMVSVGATRQYQGDLSGAESLLAEALDGLRRVHGDEHPDTLAAMSWPGELLRIRGGLSQAESLLVKTLTASRRVLGDRHLTTFWATWDLGYVYMEEGNFVESEKAFATALEVARGNRQRDSLLLAASSGLTELKTLQGQFEDAEELSAKTVEAARSMFGADQYISLTALLDRGALLTWNGNLHEAEGLLTQALARIRRGLGDQHWMVSSSKVGLADAHHAQGRLEEAKLLYAEARAGIRRIFGQDFHGNLYVLNPLAELYLDEGQSEEAESALVEAQRASSASGHEGYIIADTDTALARLRLMQRKPAAAETAARRALAIRDARHPDHWTRFDALSLIGGALAGQKKFAEAEPLLIQGYVGLKEREARTPFLWRKKRQAQAGARIVALYEAWGKKDKADEWRKKLYLLPDLPADPFRR
jgi:tetratricopeptide (TPR) repeat protein